MTRTRMPRPRRWSRGLCVAAASATIAFVLAVVTMVTPSTAEASAGELDPSFSGNGFVVASFGPFRTTNDVGRAVIVDQQDRILVAGSTSKGNDFAILRYKPDGTLDSSWSFDGRVKTDFGGADGATGLAVDGQGRVVVAGYTVNSSGHSDFAVARYMPRGRLDSSFSGDGKVTTDFRDVPFEVTSATATSVAIDSPGRIVVGGWVDTGEGCFGVARYTAGGAPDPSFSGDGRTEFVFDEASSDNWDLPYAVATDPQDRIVIAGSVDNDFGLARLTTGGSLDGSFSSDGKVVTDFRGGISSIQGIAIDSQDRIVAAGRGYYADESGDSSDTPGFALSRYLPNGSLDPTFSPQGQKGTLTTSIEGNNAVAHAVAIDSLGRIVAVGGSDPRGRVGHNLAVTRFTPEGSPDASFSGDGQVTTHIGDASWPSVAYGAAIDSRDRIVVTGQARGSLDIAVARYLGQG